MYIRKEALLSSQIEGTQSSLSDLLLFEAEEAPGVPIDDTREVANYVAAMDHGLRRLREEDFLLSLRLMPAGPALFQATLTAALYPALSVLLIHAHRTIANPERA